MEYLSSKVWQVRWLNCKCWRVATLLKIEIGREGKGNNEKDGKCVDYIFWFLALKLRPPFVLLCQYIYWLMVRLVGIVSLWVLSNTRDSFFFQNKSYNWWNSWLWAVNRLVMKFIVKKVKRRKRRSMSWLGNQTRNQCLDSNGLFTFQNSEWKWAMKSSRGCGLSTVFYRIALNYCSLDVGIFPIH